MKTTMMGCIIFCLVPSFAMKSPAENTYAVDTSKSTLHWAGYPLFSFGEHNGTLALRKGEIKTENGELTGGSFEIDMTSMRNLDMKDDDGGNSLVNHAVAQTGNDSIFQAVAQTDNGSIFLSSDQGERWNRADNGFPSEGRINDWVLKGNIIIAATQKHGIYISNDGLKTWRSSNKGLPSSVKINALKVFGNIVFAGAYREGIFVSDDNGDTWQPMNEGLGNFSIRCFHVCNTTILAGTDRGIYALETRGRSWKLITGGMQINTFAAVGGMHTSETGGRSRELLPGGMQINNFAASEGYLYAATHQGVLRSADDGKTWTEVWNGGALSALAGNKNEITGITLDGYVISSQDYGRTWIMWKGSLPMPYSEYTFRLTPASPMILFAPWKNIFKSYIQLPGFVPKGLPLTSPFSKFLSTPFGVLAAVSPGGC
jgi:hypothetical protein